MIRDFIRACLLVIVIGLVFAISPAIANSKSASVSKSASNSESESASNSTRGIMDAGDLQKISSADALLGSTGDQKGYFQSSQGISSGLSGSAQKAAPHATAQK